MPGRSDFIWRTFIDLQNPLLKKYKFDEVDFCVGATESFKHFFKTITDPQAAEYVKMNKSSSKPESILLLEEISSPQFVEVCMKSLKNIQTKELPVTFIDINIRKVSIMSLSTKICNGVVSQRDVMILQKTPALARLLTNVLVYPKTDHSMDDIQSFMPFKLPFVKIHVHKVALHPGETAYEAQDRFKHAQEKEYAELQRREENNDLGQIQYNDNSVVAVIDVLCDCVSTYKEAGSEEVKSRNVLPRLAFSGCISGHTDLEWKLISFGDLTDMIKNYKKDDIPQQPTTGTKDEGNKSGSSSEQ